MSISVHRSKLALSGLLLLFGGLVLVAFSFFWLPLWTSTFCFDACQPTSVAMTVTGWQFSLTGLAHWYVAPFPNTLALIVVYFPLCAGVILLLGGGAHLAHPGTTLMRWLAGVWIAEIVLLIALLLFIYFIIAQPERGYWGMGVSALLSGVGLVLMRVTRLERRPAH